MSTVDVGSAKIVVPFVHLNGTGREGLTEQYTTAYRAVEAAIVSLSKCNPHGRDYYPVEENAYGEASKQHTDRVRRLHSVHKELEAILVSLLD